MTRELAGVAALDALLLGVGATVLAAFGVRARGLAGLGLALACGWASMGLVCAWALVAGLSLAGWQVVLLALVVAGAALAVARRRRPVPLVVAPPLPGTLARAVGVAGAVVLGVAIFAALAKAAVATVDTEWDAWAFWVPKALSVFYTGAPDGMLELPNPGYPPLQPALDAVAFRFAGGADASLLVLQHAILLACGLLGIGALLRRSAPATFVWPTLALVALAPASQRWFDSVLADPPLALALAVAAVAGTQWALGRRPGAEVIAALFLAAAAATKDEGLLLGYLLVAALAAAGGFRAPRAMAVVAAAPLAGVLPWKLWYAAQDVTSPQNYDFGRVTDLGTVLDEVDRLIYAVDRMAGIAFGTGWLLLLPVALGAAALAARRSPRLAVVAIGWPAAAFLGLAATYWISTAPVEWYVATSAQRVLLSVFAVSAALLPLSLTVLVTVPRRPREPLETPAGPSLERFTASDEGRAVSATVVVPTRDGRERLERLLDSLAASGAEIVVVDNGSSDGSGDAATAFGATVIRLEENVGFGRAVNIGARAASGSVLVLVNDDCVCGPGFVEELASALDPAAGVVMAAGVLLEPAGATIDTAGIELDRSLLVFDHLNGQPLSALDRCPADPVGPCGAAAAFDRETFLDLGGFDEQLFAYWEDVDLVLRIVENGGRCRLATRARGVHEHSATLGSGSAAKNYLTGFGRGYVLRKWRGGGTAVVASAAWRDLPILVGQALVDRTLAGARGRRDGWRAASALRDSVAKIDVAQFAVRAAPLRRRLARRARLRARRAA